MQSRKAHLAEYPFMIKWFEYTHSKSLQSGYICSYMNGANVYLLFGALTVVLMVDRSLLFFPAPDLFLDNNEVERQPSYFCRQANEELLG